MDRVLVRRQHVHLRDQRLRDGQQPEEPRPAVPQLIPPDLVPGDVVRGPAGDPPAGHAPLHAPFPPHRIPDEHARWRRGRVCVAQGGHGVDDCVHAGR